jgi:hypothetical protein
MARPKKHNEGLTSYTLHISPRLVFALKMIARTGETRAEGTVLEEAIQQIADKLPISRHWSELWSTGSPSVTWLNAYALPEYRPIVKEQKRFEFIMQHSAFFYRDKAKTHPIAENANVLWDDIDELAEEWTKKKKTDYWVAAKKMAAMLKKAGLNPPPFGSETSRK